MKKLILMFTMLIFLGIVIAQIDWTEREKIIWGAIEQSPANETLKAIQDAYVNTGRNVTQLEEEFEKNKEDLKKLKDVLKAPTLTLDEAKETGSKWLKKGLGFFGLGGDGEAEKDTSEVEKEKLQTIREKIATQKKGILELKAQIQEKLGITPTPPEVPAAPETPAQPEVPATPPAEDIENTCSKLAKSIHENLTDFNKLNPDKAKRDFEEYKKKCDKTKDYSKNVKEFEEYNL